MTMTSQAEQTVPVQLHRAQGLLLLAAPMPGLEPQDISVSLHHDRVTIRGDYRASRHDQPETVISEWTIGPYHCDVSLPQPVGIVVHTCRSRQRLGQSMAGARVTEE